MSGGTLIAIAMLLPVVGGFIVLMLGKHPNARETVTLLTGGLTFWHVYQLLPMVQAGERPRLDLFEVVPGVQIAFEVEPLGMLFALVAAFLWPITSLYAIGYMRGHHEENQSRPLPELWASPLVRISSHSSRSMRY
jgi:multicomponent Na+:H+ antiporter subunit D